jgi:predicted Zn-dependent protease
LVEYTKVFFDRQVQVLPAATLKVMNAHRTSNAKLTSKKSQRNNNTSTSSRLGAFAEASKCRFKLSLPGKGGKAGSLPTQVDVAGRMDPSSDRIQLQVTSLLDELSAYRYNRHSTMTSKEPKDFCIMGITMEDLFDGPSDLFCAGMAFGGDKVAIFSFHRYHPLLKMHPLHWHSYGYTDKCDGYSYYEDDDQDPTGLSHRPPLSSNLERVADKTTNMNSEFLRRSCKLLTHELGHLYGLDHCIHNRCLMMGTGHLVEDFSAPIHLCGICLRKLQWRTGCDIQMRYKLLTDIFRSMGMEKERNWTRKQYEHLKKK